MKNVLILHGTGGDSKENWLPWLAIRLKEKGYTVDVPDLPKSDTPDIDRYAKFIFPRFTFDKDTILIGHSSGAVAILGLLQMLPKSIVINRSILVSGFVDANLTDFLFTKISRKNFIGLFPKAWDWKKIKDNCSTFKIIQSDDDPYVQPSHTQALRDKLDGELVIVPGGSHFSVNSGGERFKKFPEILNHIP